MKLPDVFQMRVDTLPGYTHVVERIPSGGYEVKWARGWSKVRDIEWHVCTVKQAQAFVDEGGWIVVEDKKVEQGLPDEFYFKCKGEDTLFRAVKDGIRYDITWHGQSSSSDYFSEQAERYVVEGHWTIVSKQSLTPEQLRSNAEFREQIAALEQSVRLNKLDIEHKENLIKSYEARKKELESKLVVESV